MPMQKTFSPAEAEDRISALWEERNAFRAGANASKDETFCIMIPPPNVTGSLHMGHAFNNTLQDILTRWHRMRGFDTLWQPGTDHAGIATQMVVERELAKTNRRRTDMSREDFTALVWEQKQKSRGNIAGQLKRIGASCDWSREAFTMSGAPGAPEGEDGNFHDAVIKVFVDLYNKGLIYRGKRLVNWDPHFETAISDLEVESIEVDGHMWHFKYPLAGGETYEYVEKDEDGNVTLRETRDYISIATTRPETMLGDGAVAVHPSDERYAPIIGKLCEIPVGPKEHRRLIPIITDEYPDPDFGSGAVKITGAHDFNDYQVAKRGGIPMYRLMDTKGQMRADGVPYAEAATIAMTVAKGERSLDEAEADTINLVPDHLRGLDRFEARKKVIEEITTEGLAVMTDASDPRLGKKAAKPDEDTPLPPVPLVEAKKIMQPFGDRSKVVIEPMLTDQWFVDAEKIVGPAIDAVKDGRTKILPEQHEKVYFNWLNNIEPWCISRQLWWGHQIPVWYGPDGERFCAENYELAIEAAAEHYNALNEEGALADAIGAGSSDTGSFDGVQVFAIDDSHGSRIDSSGRNVASPSKSDGWSLSHDEYFINVEINLSRDPDVLDTWFSSGLWPIGTLGWPEDTPELKKYFPTDVLITGFDILFFWVARMMMMQQAVVKEIPFHTVYVHALVRDEKGKKMSKSLGNVIDPLELIDEYGADAMRFTLTSMAGMGRDLKLSTSRVEGNRNFATKIWNAFRFAEMNAVFEGDAVHGQCTDSVQPVPPSAAANKWIIGETARIRVEVDEALAAYRFNDAANGLYAFIWGKVCDWYIEFAKPLFDNEETAQETRQTMRWVLEQCLVLLHPIMPFVTEELWQETGDRAKLLAHTEWPSYGLELVDSQAEKEMRWVISLIDGIRSARMQMRVPAGLKLAMIVTEWDSAAETAWARNEALIQKLARIESLTQGPMPKGAIIVPVEGATFALPLEGVIDVAEEKARLSKTLEKLEKELGGLRGRLKNPKFIDSAPDEVVEETREKLALGEDEAAKLKTALAGL